MEKYTASHFNTGVPWVFQILETYPDKGYIGAFIVMDEWKPWGIQGCIHHVKSREEAQVIPLRVEWEHLELVGSAPLS